MSQIEIFLRELDLEAQITRKMLSRVPEDKYDWRPHPKSMTIRRLATHIAELPSWITMALNTSELDFSKNAYKERQIQNNKELMEFFEKSLDNGRSRLSNATEDELSQPWSLRNGEHVFFTTSKGEVIRTFYSQVVHHRAQMGVFLRLLDIPIPGSYGPSADENFA
jgi:uncharacterized damage-inducible protein DinB